MDKYKKHELRDHIYKLPDTYIGSIEPSTIETYVVNGSSQMEKKTVSLIPGLYKIFDEIAVNALDHIMRLTKDKTKPDIKPVKNIKFNVDKATGRITVFNDGDGIDIDMHPEYNIYIPQLIFGELLTSTNYDENEEKLWGGKNGYGSKLTNIFSKEFQIETVDHRRQKMYTQTFRDNMKVIEKPSIKKSVKTPYTKISFIPDYTRFGISGLTDDMYNLFYKRAMDACATSDQSVSIYFNDTKLNIKNFEKYAELYIGTKDKHPHAYEVVNDRWEVIATYSDSSHFEQVSFVNGINTLRGGKHIEYVSNQIIKRLTELIATKMKKEVKPQFIKDNLFLFVKCLIVNPAFDTQTKESLTTPASKFGSKCELSDKFFTSLYKTGIVDKAINLTDFHQDKKMAKTDGKKKTRIFVQKLDDANKAGTRESDKCTLILTEGDSAKTMAVAGLSVVGRDYYGIFPLRGKLLNVKDAAAKKIADNEEVTNLKQILGLKQGQDYSDVSSLRYGKIMCLCDQDTDGYHIKGLLFNIFGSMWPSLFKMDKFLVSMLTPIIKVSSVSLNKSHKFYSITDFENWRKQQESTSAGLRGWKIKYYKGLGTSTESEAKEYFKEMKMLKYKYTGKLSDEAMDLAFNKKRSDDRKVWLMNFDMNNILDYNTTEVSYEDFVNKELIHFSNRDLERSINNICDGLKESTRKILFACFKRKLFRDELKVAQLAAYIAEHTAYHHGEASLQQAIIGMAQDFVGANNLNILMPNGQFGSRISGGQDASSPRYIYTVLSPLARKVFREEDNPILEYLDDDGMSIEPKYYIPIIPMILVNGGMGIGTGFSTNVPCHNPEEIINICIKLAENVGKDIKTKEELADAFASIHNTEIPLLVPWYLGFRGTITKSKSNGYQSKGTYRWTDSSTLEITELPVGTWTDDYKEYLTNMAIAQNSIIKDFENHYTAKTVKFVIKMASPSVRDQIDTDTEFKLSSTKGLSLNNINLFSESGAIKAYSNTEQVIKEWACIRIAKYVERKQYQLQELERQHVLISAKVRFINDFIAGVIQLVNKTGKQVNEQLKSLKYPTKKAESGSESGSDSENESGTNEGGYDYLTGMALKTLTVEKKKELEKEEYDIRMKIEALRFKGVHDIWKDELIELLKDWKDYRTAVEEIYEADRSGEVPVVKKKGIKK